MTRQAAEKSPARSPGPQTQLGFCNVFFYYAVPIWQGKSVCQELYCLEVNGWYHLFDHLHFWPVYLNGQGSRLRKLEGRYQRTTECGGPRKPILDLAGLRAHSLNEALLRHHLPRWYEDRAAVPAMRGWLDAKGFLTLRIWACCRRCPTEPSLPSLIPCVMFPLSSRHHACTASRSASPVTTPGITSNGSPWLARTGGSLASLTHAPTLRSLALPFRTSVVCYSSRSIGWVPIGDCRLLTGVAYVLLSMGTKVTVRMCGPASGRPAYTRRSHLHCCRC